MPAITDPIDLLLGTDNDLVIVNGDLAFVTGADAVAQGIRIAIQMFNGEWFANLDVGIRYLENDHVTASQALLAEKFNAVKARAEFRREILAVDGVAEITSLDVTFDRTSRTLKVVWAVRTIFGEPADDTTVRTL